MGKTNGSYKEEKGWDGRWRLYEDDIDDLLSCKHKLNSLLGVTIKNNIKIVAQCILLL